MPPPMIFIMPNSLAPPQTYYPNQYSPQRPSHDARSRSSVKRDKQTITYQDGSSYEGDTLEGMRDGFGKLIFRDGAYYEGNWREDKMHGQG